MDTVMIPIFLNAFICSHRTAFGREMEVTGQTHFNTHKVEDLQNHFMVVTGSLEDTVASLSLS